MQIAHFDMLFQRLQLGEGAPTQQACDLSPVNVLLFIEHRLVRIWKIDVGDEIWFSTINMGLMIVKKGSRKRTARPLLPFISCCWWEEPAELRLGFVFEGGAMFLRWPWRAASGGGALGSSSSSSMNVFYK